MTVHVAKAHIMLSGDALVREALKDHWDKSLTAKQAAPLVARVLMRTLNALGFDARKKRDLDVLDMMLKGWVDRAPQWRPDGRMVYPILGGAGAGDYLEQEVMELVFRNTAIFSPPANVYIGLTTTATTDVNNGGTEVATGSYARVAVGTTSGWSAPGSTGGATANAADITFPTATGNWGTVSHTFGNDALTVGNRFFHGALTASKTVNSGDDLIIPTGDLDVVFA